MHPHNLTVNIPHTNFVVFIFFTCAHPKWQNSQSDDGGRSTEEGKRNIIIFGINVISDRHYIMTGRFAIIITQHKIKTRRPAITIDKRYIMAQRLAINID